MNGLAVCTKKSIYCSVLADFVYFFFPAHWAICAPFLSLHLYCLGKLQSVLDLIIVIFFLSIFLII